jgi:hypothetical protein
MRYHGWLIALTLLFPSFAFGSGDLFEGLRHEEWRMRFKAHKAIAAQAWKLLPEVEKHAQHSPDAEVKRRCNQILERYYNVADYYPALCNLETGDYTTNAVMTKYLKQHYESLENQEQSWEDVAEWLGQLNTGRYWSGTNEGWLKEATKLYAKDLLKAGYHPKMIRWLLDVMTEIEKGRRYSPYDNEEPD